MVGSSWEHKALYQNGPEMTLKQKNLNQTSLFCFNLEIELYRDGQLANAMPFGNKEQRKEILKGLSSL